MADVYNGCHDWEGLVGGCRCKAQKILKRLSPYESYGKFDLYDMDDSECLSEFRFRKSDLPVLSEALHLPNYFTCQQYALELKGCVLHFKGLRTHVDSVI